MEWILSELTDVMRLVIAAFLGGVVGLERQQRHKSAGLRDPYSGESGVLSRHGDFNQNLYRRSGTDQCRPGTFGRASGSSGSGFLGAGTIMKEGLTIKGLTTAASLWVVAGVGLAVGGGYYVGAVATTVLSVLALTYLPRYERLYGCGPSQVAMIIKSVTAGANRPGRFVSAPRQGNLRYQNRRGRQE